MCELQNAKINQMQNMKVSAGSHTVHTVYPPCDLGYETSDIIVI